MNEPTWDGYLLTILPRIPAFLSMLGSAMIVSSVVRSAKNRGHMQQRIVGMMSCFDLMVSVVWFFTFLFIPPEKFEEKGFPLALGNNASCDAQGFFIQLSTASFLYNVSLSVYYILMIKYRWSEQKMAAAEKYFHIFPIGWGLVTAILAVSMGLIGDADWDCWVEARYNVYQWLFFFGPLFLSLIITTFNLLQVLFHVKKTETNAAKWRKTARSSIVYRNTTQVLKQNQLYFASFFVTWFLPSIARSMQAAGKEVPSWFVVVCGTVIPFQGFFNAIVYFRLRFQRCGRDHPDKGWYWIVYRIALLTLVPCFLDDDHNIHDGRDVERMDSSTFGSSDVNEIPHQNSRRSMKAEKDPASSVIMPDDDRNIHGGRDAENVGSSATGNLESLHVSGSATVTWAGNVEVKK